MSLLWVKLCLSPRYWCTNPSTCVCVTYFIDDQIRVRSWQWHPTPVLLPGKSHGRRSLIAAVHGVAEGRTRLSDFTFTFHFHVLEKEMATHSSVLAWRIPGMGEPGGLPSMGSHRVRHDWSALAAAAAAAWEWALTQGKCVPTKKGQFGHRFAHKDVM